MGSYFNACGFFIIISAPSYLMIFSRVTKNNISLLLDDFTPCLLLVEGSFEVISALLFNCPFVKSVHDQTRDKTSGETQTDAFFRTNFSQSWLACSFIFLHTFCRMTLKRGAELLKSRQYLPAAPKS